MPVPAAGDSGASADTIPLAAAVPRSAQAEGLGWGILGVAAFSLSLPATRLAVTGGLDPVLAGLGRAVVAGVLALLALWWGRVRGRPPRGALPRLAVVAAGVVFVFPLLTSMALSKVPAAHGIIASGLLPAATAVTAVLRAGERPSFAFWAASGAGLVCVVAFALTRGSGDLATPDLLLLAAVAAAGIGYAEGGVLAREMGGPAVICWALILALPATLAAAMPHVDLDALAAVRPSAWAGFVYLSAVSMFLGFFAWYRGLALGGVARVGQLQLAQPVLSLIWAALLVGEPLTWQNLAAAAAVFACVAATQLAR